MVKTIGKNNIKFTQEYVESYYKEKGCLLLDNYKNASTPLKYLCHCSHENTLSFDKFKKQKNGCRYCTKIGGYKLEDVYNYFKEHDCELLETTYSGVKKKMKYKCSCGNISEISFDNFKSGKRCNKCGLDKLSEQFKTDIKHVIDYFIKNNCVPMFDEYKNDRQKLKYKCSCGNISSITFADFKSGRRCNKCSTQRRLNTFYKNGTQKCSLQQKYILDLIGGKLNYPIANSSLDIAFPDEMIYIEYDGGGHDLSVKLGEITDNKFREKEKRRNYGLYKLGWKSIRIISKKDYLPSDTKIKEIIQLGKNILKERSWIVFDIDNSEVKYNNFTDLYDFGETKRLRNDYVS